MLLIIPALFVAILLPVVCVNLLMDDEAHPTIKALAILCLSPYVFFVVHTLRINL